MANFPAVRLMRASVASGDAIDVRHFRVLEGMSELFEIQIGLASPNPDINLDAVVGQVASLTVQAGVDGVDPSTDHTWSGIATALQQVATEDAGLSTYQLTLSPLLWLLTRRRNYRVFQHRSEVEIARALLREWNIPFVDRLSESYKKREYRVQYGESDYGFFCRMLEEAGVSFFFEAGDGETRLILNDAPQRRTARRPLVFKDHVQDGNIDHVTNVRVTRHVQPGKYTLQDQDYRKPATYKLQSSAMRGLPVEQDLETCDYAPGSFLFQSEKGDGTPVADDKGKYRAEEGEGRKLATRRLEAGRTASKTFSFDTNAADVAPGVVLTVLDHPKSELSPEQKLLVTRSVWEGSPAGEWHKSCEAVSAHSDHRPLLKTPKPRVNGVETATVVGPSNEHVHTDEFGRVRVQFHWDREGTMDDGSSCWIPVSHPWAGTGFGVVNLPRIGQEVIIDFLGGDPDRPLVVGRVYTSVQRVPYTLPSHKTQSGWKSQTVGGTGYNEIMFEDAPGRELVRMQAERNLTKLVKANESVTIGHDRTKQVGHDDTLTVGNDRSRTVGNDESVMVGNNQSIIVGVNQSITVGADQTIALPAGNQTETITGDRDFTLTGNLTEKITGNSTLTQVGNQSEKITGSSSRNQIGEQTATLLGDKSHVQLGGQMEILAGKRTFVDLGDQLDIQLGGRKDFQLGSRLDIQLGGYHRIQMGASHDTTFGSREQKTSTNASENVGAKKKVVAGTYELHAPSTEVNAETLNLNGTVTEVKGTTINLDAKGVVTIKGGVIKLNC